MIIMRKTSASNEVAKKSSIHFCSRCYVTENCVIKSANWKVWLSLNIKERRLYCRYYLRLFLFCFVFSKCWLFSFTFHWNWFNCAFLAFVLVQCRRECVSSRGSATTVTVRMGSPSGMPVLIWEYGYMRPRHFSPAPSTPLTLTPTPGWPGIHDFL